MTTPQVILITPLKLKHSKPNTCYKIEVDGTSIAKIEREFALKNWNLNLVNEIITVQTKEWPDPNPRLRIFDSKPIEASVKLQATNVIVIGHCLFPFFNISSFFHFVLCFVRENGTKITIFRDWIIGYLIPNRSIDSGAISTEIVIAPE